MKPKIILIVIGIIFIIGIAIFILINRPSETQLRIQEKANKVQAGIEKLISAGGDPTQVQNQLQELDPLLKAKKYDDAENILDRVLLLLDKKNQEQFGTSTANGTASGLIAVSYQDEKGRYQIFTVSPDGSNRKQLTNDGNGNVAPKWSPDGKKIAYMTQSEAQNGIVFHVMNADGSDNKAITEKRSGSMSLLPDWSPDGEHIAYTAGLITPDMEQELASGKKDPMDIMNVKIFVIDADGSNKKQLTFGNDSDAVPSWSPDGKRIAFASDRDWDKFRIWVMDSDGKNPVALTESSYDNSIGAPVEQKVPAWSPDGKYIAYWQGVEMFELSEATRKGTSQPTARDRNIMATWHIWVMDADGTNKRMLTQGDDPAWSPDSKMILHPTLPIYGENPEPIGVGATNLDGTNRHVLFTVPGIGPQRYSWQPVR